MPDEPLAPDPRPALRALATVAGFATIGLLATLFAGPPEIIAQVPAWTMYSSAGALLAALIGLELARRTDRLAVLGVLAKLGFALLVVVALFLAAQLVLNA